MRLAVRSLRRSPSPALLQRSRSAVLRDAVPLGADRPASEDADRARAGHHGPRIRAGDSGLQPRVDRRPSLPGSGVVWRRRSTPTSSTSPSRPPSGSASSRTCAASSFGANARAWPASPTTISTPSSRFTHAPWPARAGASISPRTGFRQLLRALSGAGLCRLFHARQPDGRVVASQLVLLGPGGRCHVVAAAADEAFLRSGVSAFLRWKSFEALSAAGYKEADLTDASLNAVTHFKSQLGGELQVLLVLDAPRTLYYRLGSAGQGRVPGSPPGPRLAPRVGSALVEERLDDHRRRPALPDSRGPGRHLRLRGAGDADRPPARGLAQKPHPRRRAPRHELAASFMANGYYRASGRVAPLVTIPGPGFTYALTGLAEALHDSAAVLHIVGCAPGIGSSPALSGPRPACHRRPAREGQSSHRHGRRGPLGGRGGTRRAPLGGEPGPVLLEWTPAALEAAALSRALHGQTAPPDGPRPRYRRARRRAAGGRAPAAAARGAGLRRRARAAARAGRAPVGAGRHHRLRARRARRRTIRWPSASTSCAATAERRTSSSEQADLILALGCKLGRPGPRGSASSCRTNGSSASTRAPTLSGRPTRRALGDPGDGRGLPGLGRRRPCARLPARRLRLVARRGDGVEEEAPGGDRRA